MKLSVAMCTYNGSRFVGEQLESLAAQERPPDELIVCDDCSSDETREIVKAFAPTAPFPVRLVLNERNLGSTKNFEKAIGLCGGELIALCDQDDVWLPQKLRRTESLFLTEPQVGLVFTDAEVVDENLQPLGYRLLSDAHFNRAKRRRMTEGKAFDLLLERNVLTGATMTFRALYKDLILPIPTGIKYIHDGWIAVVVSAVARLNFIDEPMVKYRQHAEQQIGSSPPQEETTSGVAALRQATQRDNDFLVEIDKLEMIRERLLSRSNVYQTGPALAQLEPRIIHFKERAQLPERKLSRLPCVLRELLARRYHLYSRGLASAVKDLFFEGARKLSS